MAATPRLPLRLYEKLGEEAMTDLMTMFGEVQADIKELKEGQARLESDMKAGFADLKVQIARVQSELIKWTFVFWLGTVGIVVMLIRFLNHSAG